jgi:DMSO/TMAO reductase YedYZ molybdopterin-dependent catalytic subunit
LLSSGSHRKSWNRRACLGSLLGSLAFPFIGRAEELSALDWSLIADRITPDELFFVRTKGSTPKAASLDRRLKIDGMVTAARTLALDSLLRESRRDLAVTLSCREQSALGGLVSHAEWSGFPLAGILEAAGVSPDSQSVRLHGADGYSMLLDMAKARDGSVLLCDRMNGNRLPDAHGFPVRAIVPGWLGSHSVKWLTRIEVSGEASPPSPLQVFAAFARPVDGAVLSSRKFLMRGVAWAGEFPIASVETSVDGGRNWRPAKLDDAPARFAWLRWSQPWTIAVAGEHSLFVRATDARNERSSSSGADKIRVIAA